MSKLLVLDPGHSVGNVNGSPDGTYFEWIFAQEVCDIAFEMIKYIPGLTAIKTKEMDTTASLFQRTNLANSKKADLFLSVHSNAFGPYGQWTSPRGFGVYVYYGRNLDLAKIAFKYCNELLNMPSHGTGIKERNLYVIRETRMPSLLYEFGFHSKRQDVEMLKTHAFRVNCAKVVVKTACEFLGVKYVEKQDTIKPPAEDKKVEPRPNPDSINIGIVYHKVVRGDALLRIVNQYNSNLNVILKINPEIINPDMIHVNQIIKVPKNINLENIANYVVQKGDNLTKISNSFKTDIKEIMKYNSMIKNPNIIVAGWELAIPLKKGVKFIPPYTIQTGDSLWRIANRNNFTVNELVSYNNIDNPNLIYPGQVINFPIK